MRSSGPGCRLHGPRCRVPWGWDPAHTDSARPYSVEELAIRPDCPHRYAYATVEDYLQGWRLWRAMRRDDGLSAAELEARYAVVDVEIAEILERMKRES
ncbi:hypothetical protein ACFFMN_23435 [Planobispora siamensis]|uniref:Uncharacterized protein n=1 Tax=Planobispora siamensis TaxID=936338 RepID=A0A8J3SJ95_9ACTN|nr:hypothetical protein [Planobispora siamensis]GIH95317.1 hypothetical protein Psi01_59470 [Planobispora siamensis]